MIKLNITSFLVLNAAHKWDLALLSSGIYIFFGDFLLGESITRNHHPGGQFLTGDSGDFGNKSHWFILPIICKIRAKSRKGPVSRSSQGVTLVSHSFTSSYQNLPGLSQGTTWLMATTWLVSEELIPGKISDTCDQREPWSWNFRHQLRAFFFFTESLKRTVHFRLYPNGNST